MEKIQQTTLLMEHIKKSHMQDVFSFDVSTIAELFSFQPQEFLIEVGHNSDYLYFLTSGEIMVCTYTISEKFHSQCYYHGLAPILGEASILWGKPDQHGPGSYKRNLCGDLCEKAWRTAFK